ncbi:FAD/NAD(P)-binding protein [Streptomyces spectabilis]|uniref:Putative NAD(P)/FAD-binding protein YdhS n=1 Tax=Streptomyces spectabilis TaxID=68270 RepID=A0A5P2X5F6_STRST|nr:FAD/NAD(P)-binding protein [Streptomyces spectabilis]MBB5100986.1 putative NAD(P)/FAD-binding protein YdhS [Streptomyces spectabilis]MCI3900199.1 FAD/NAD(P)-binding protein [Streptomyces spectabilis]QEV57806.1 hypothetical protein CP982_03000 [Streptomyces spectabilis]GGV08841.1 hypothetical protein GCM10010245_16610 [Streptomyces spectabilis]
MTASHAVPDSVLAYDHQATASTGTDDVSVALVGCGPRGLNVLERLVHRARTHGLRGTVHVIEPGPLGVGVHHRGQPDYLRLHTPADRLTAFTDPHMVDGGGVAGPSLYAWARGRGLTVREPTGDETPVRPDHHLPRAMLGEYLAWAAQTIVAAAPAGLRVLHHRATAVDVVPAVHRGGERVVLNNGGVLGVAHVVLAVGHTGAVPMPAPGGADTTTGHWIADPYPLPGSLDGIPPGATVGLLGAGLTCADVVAAVTVGRGGRYVRDGVGCLRYLPSGREPALVLLSRSGLPARARPKPSARPPTDAAHLTFCAVQRLRSLCTGRALDFRRDVLPLVEREMRHRYAARAIALGKDPGGLGDGFLGELVRGTIPRHRLASYHHYRTWYAHYLGDDLREAELGLDGSPLKYSLEALGDLREELRRTVDEPGLTAESTRYFFGSFAAAVSRTVIGPQPERNAELLALLAAGVARPGPGPAARVGWHAGARSWEITSTELAVPAVVHADHLVAARTAAPAVLSSLNPVIRSLRDKGRLRCRLAGDLVLGADVTRVGRPVGGDGRVQHRLFVLGPLAEGSSYYNHYVAAPGAPSRAVADAQRAVECATRP